MQTLKTHLSGASVVKCHLDIFVIDLLLKHHLVCSIIQSNVTLINPQQLS